MTAEKRGEQGKLLKEAKKENGEPNDRMGLSKN